MNFSACNCFHYCSPLTLDSTLDPQDSLSLVLHMLIHEQQGQEDTSEANGLLQKAASTANRLAQLPFSLWLASMVGNFQGYKFLLNRPNPGL